MTDASTLTMQQLIDVGYELKASDVMVKGGSRPFIKKDSQVQPMPGDWPVIDPVNAHRMLSELMTDRQREHFAAHHEMDLGFNVGNHCRVRTNVYKQRGVTAAVCRIIPLTIRGLEELGMPPSLAEVVKHRQGLVLVTGPTGSGKTTTLAAMIDIINRSRKAHIVTVEDPLEFVHQDKEAYVSQREVGIDTDDFEPALRAVVREAPDVILIGEMRDIKTMNVALQAGETGHLVFSTVHTSSAYETLDRIINMFPPHEKNHLCLRLAGSLRAIIAQKLVPRADGEGRVAACEILVASPTVSKKIEDGHFTDLYDLMREPDNYWGMQTMNQSLVKHVKDGVITAETAMQYAGILSELKQMLRR